ncbi:SCO4402 family protein [Streptomyces xantholiticus]
MPPDGFKLQTPWVRAQLVDWLLKLSGRGWQEDEWVYGDSSGPGLDDALDFFDDSGVLDAPRGTLGFVLINEEEVSAMEELNRALDRAISISPSDGEIVRSPAWLDVVAAARAALNAMNEEYK